MIGKITGTLSEIHADAAYIETAGGVTYRVQLSPTFRGKVGHIGNKVVIYTYLDIKEDSHTLFGFDTYENYHTFSLLLSVDGVGPKTAYMVVSAHEPQHIMEAIRKNDVFFFQNIKGIGKKTAQRIIVDLASKIGADANLESMYINEDKDAVEALLSLGFKRQEILRSLHGLTDDMPLEEKLKQALQLLTKRDTQH